MGHDLLGWLSLVTGIAAGFGAVLVERRLRRRDALEAAIADLQGYLKGKFGYRPPAG